MVCQSAQFTRSQRPTVYGLTVSGTAQAEPSLLQKLPVQVAPASQDTLLQLTAVSAALAAWSLAQVVLQHCVILRLFGSLAM